MAHAGSEHDDGRLDNDASRRTALLLAVAITALALGTLVYLTDRAPGHAVLVPHLAGFGAAPILGAAGAWLPSFVHPLAFALLTAAVLPPTSPWRYGGCAAWGAVNVAFELGQHATLKGAWLAAMATGAVPSPLARYFILGSFDGADLVAAVAGALAAAAFLRYLDHFQENDRAR